MSDRVHEHDEVALDPETFGSEQPCFGCSPKHPTGLRLRFTRAGDEIVTRFVPLPEHQGPPNIMHGGLVMTLADELAAWVIIGLKGRLGFTTSVEARLLKPARIGVEIVGRGRLERDAGRVLTITVSFTQQDAEIFRGKFVFALLDRSGAERVLGGPLPESWQRFCRS